jgi:hypothetical protein
MSRLHLQGQEWAEQETSVQLAAMQNEISNDNGVIVNFPTKWHSSTFHVRSFREADCDTDHYLDVAKVRE